MNKLLIRQSYVINLKEMSSLGLHDLNQAQDGLVTSYYLSFGNQQLQYFMTKLLFVILQLDINSSYPILDCMFLFSKLPHDRSNARFHIPNTFVPISPYFYPLTLQINVIEFGKTFFPIQFFSITLYWPVFVYLLFSTDS